MPKPVEAEPAFLRGGGVMGALVRARDWPELGAPDAWPAALRHTLAAVLAAPQPMMLCWGPRLLTFYNDAYLPLLGKRHPTALGAPFAESFADLPGVEQPALAALAGAAQLIERAPFVIEGVMREFTYSLTPVRADSGVEGVLCVTTETTARAAAARRAALAVELDRALRGGGDMAAVLGAAAAALGAALDAGRVSWIEMTGDACEVAASWADGMPQPPDAVPRAWLPPDLEAALRGAAPFAVEDVRADMRTAGFATHPMVAPLHPCAALVVPYRADGRLSGVLLVEAPVRRVWPADDVSLAADAAERGFATLARARAEAEARTAIAELQGAEERMRLAGEATGVGAWERDIRADTLNWTPAMYAIYGRDPALGAPRDAEFMELLHPADAERLQRDQENRLASRDPDQLYQTEFRVRRPDGSWRRIVARAKMLMGPDGRPERFVGVNVDVTEARAAEDAREAAESARARTAALLEAIGASSPDLIYAKDREGRMLYANPATLAVLGRPAEAVLGRTAVEYGEPGDGGETHLANDLRIIATGVGETMDEPFTSPDGVRRVFRSNKAPLRDASGAVIGIVGVTTDVTERRAEEARQSILIDLLDQLRAGGDAQAVVARVLAERLDVSRVGYAIVEPDGEHVVVNHEWSTDAPSVVGRWRLDDFDPAMHAAFRAGEPLVIDDVERDPRSEMAERFRRAGTRSVLTTPVLRGGRLAALLYLNHREPRAWAPSDIALMREIAERAWDAVERERVVRELAAAEDRLRLATEAAEIGFWDVDPVADTLFWPPRVKAMFGISAGVPVSMADFYDGVHPEDRERTAALYAAAADPAVRALYDAEYRTVGKEDGVVRWVAAKGRGVFDPDGRCVRVVGTAIDVTARKAVEEELRQLNATLAERVRDAVAAREEALAQLHEAQKLETLGQLTGGVAHDFNNLLQPVIGGLDLLRRRTDDARAVKLIDGALQSAERAKTLVQRLLAFARRQQLRPVAVDVAALMQGMRDLIERSLDPRIAIAIVAEPGLPPALVDPNQLELALLNLAVNGRDAMPDGGALHLHVALDADGGPAPGAFIRVAVRDTGIGMDAATLARAVEPFFSTKEVGRGTGLGLSMVHGLAAQSGGAFRLASAPGDGTTATLWLPVAEGPAQVAAVRMDAPRAAAPARLLLVDDNPAVRASTAAALAELGYAVTEAETGPAGIAALERERFDLVVTDYLMPGMNGAELARLAAARGVPTLLITGYAALTDEEVRGLDILPKPFSLAELGARVAAPLAARG